MTYFAGLDVSLEETAIRVVDEKGGIVKEIRAAREPAARVVVLQGLGLEPQRIGGGLLSDGLAV
jgi:transposase